MVGQDLHVVLIIEHFHVKKSFRAAAILVYSCFLLEAVTGRSGTIITSLVVKYNFRSTINNISNKKYAKLALERLELEGLKRFLRF